MIKLTKYRIKAYQVDFYVASNGYALDVYCYVEDSIIVRHFFSMYGGFGGSSVDLDKVTDEVLRIGSFSVGDEYPYLCYLDDYKEFEHFMLINVENRVKAHELIRERQRFMEEEYDNLLVGHPVIKGKGGKSVIDYLHFVILNADGEWISEDDIDSFSREENEITTPPLTKKQVERRLIKEVKKEMKEKEEQAKKEKKENVEVDEI